MPRPPAQKSAENMRMSIGIVLWSHHAGIAPFEYATRVFFDPYRLDGEDTRRDYQEERRITLGRIY